MTVNAWLGAVLVVAAVPIAGNEELRLRVSPEMSVEPAWIIVQVSVEPDEENQAIQIEAESEDFFRSSQVQLDGSKASRTSVFHYRGLPAGEYEVRGILIGRDGHERAVARRTVMVLE